VHDSDVFCFGPGLRTNECTREAVSSLLYRACQKGTPVVIDADMEWLLGKDMDLLFDNFPLSPVILSLNAQEFKSLYFSVHIRGLMSFHPSEAGSDHEKEQEDEEDIRPEGVPPKPRCRRGSKEAYPINENITNQYPMLQEFHVNDYADQTCITETAHVCLALGKNVTIIRKGVVDIITNGYKCILCSGVGIPKRCVGQGNILVGLVATFAS